MPTNIPGSSASYPANIVAPVDGDPRNAASVQTPLTNLADRTAWLKNNASRMLVCFGNKDLGTANSYPSLGYSASTSPSIETDGGRIVVPSSGRLTMMAVRVMVPFAGAGAEISFRVRVNTFDVSGNPLECKLGPGAYSASDAVGSIAVAAGDTISVFSEVSGTITTSAKQASISFILTLDA